MRIKIVFSKANHLVPNNQKFVNSYIHKCLGQGNIYHDSHSNYCVSRMCGGKVVDGGKNVDFSKGGFIIVTSRESEFMDKLIFGVMQNQEFGFGMSLIDVQMIEEKIYDGFNNFRTLDSGFILKTITGKDSYKFNTIFDDGFEDLLTNHLKNKFSKIDTKLNFEGFKIEIPKHPNHKTRNIFVKNVKNIANVCMFTVHANKNIAQMIYDYGVGQSTGSGFGTVYNVENQNIYY